MEKIEFNQIQEELYHEKLDNGLDVFIFQKRVLIRPMLRLQRNMVPLIITLFPLENQSL